MPLLTELSYYGVQCESCTAEFRFIEPDYHVPDADIAELIAAGWYYNREGHEINYDFPNLNRFYCPEHNPAHTTGKNRKKGGK